MAAIANHTFDALIIGTGAAGLSLALRLPSNMKVGIISKRELAEGNTRYAQGGISAVLDADDSIESHIQDTLLAGAGLCDKATVEMIVKKASHNIDWLLSQGVKFTETPPTGTSGYHLTREGGHSHRRVIHAADATGEAVAKSLEQQARDSSNITILEHHIAIDLITKIDSSRNQQCYGSYLLDLKTCQVKTVAAKFTVIATGGASKAYLYTSNPDVATGDGIAMAWRAGCRISNMEFIQFHPTCLYHPKAKSFLLTEAIRGEGGKLKLPNGNSFMQDYDDRAELAPRDIVARAIDNEMKTRGLDNVYLDISHKPAEFILSHFPTIYKQCLEFGLDMTKEALPIVPAAHYTCGGIMTDKEGETDISGLYAIGEAAYTGLHGANRMASNSLLECLVYGELAAKHISENQNTREIQIDLENWDDSRVIDSDEAVVVSHNWEELRHFMWDYVGIVRSNKRLERAARRIKLLKHEIREYYSNFKITNDLLELRNLVEVASLIVDSAQRRKESRGLHYNLDFPEVDKGQNEPTILIPDNYKPKVVLDT